MRRCVALGMAVVLAMAGCTASRSPAPAPSPTTLTGAPGQTAVISGWQIQDSSKVSGSGEEISRPGYAATGWLSVPARSTVLAGLVHAGVYHDLFTSTRLQQVSAVPFRRPWWYRATFTAATPRPTVLHLAGVIPRADGWLNGTRLAPVAGAHNATDVDVTSLVRPGVNALALRVVPADPKADLAIGWIDWNPWPPDNNMGIWQDVTLHQTGTVALSDLRVTTALALPDLGSADVTARVDVHNTTDASTTATVSGSLADASVTQTLALAPRATATATLAVHVAKPKVWWPAPLGAHPLYRAALTATVGGTASDSLATTFGIRDVKSTVDSAGHRVFTVNGRDVLIRGGGWAPDLLLRTDLTRLRKQFDVVRDLGLNAIRMEGKLETDEFYDLADQYGILLLPGWECCDKWAGYANKAPWSDADYQLAAASMSAVARRIRNHPSVLAYLVGSDDAPDQRLESAYLAALSAAGWPDPVISSASAKASPRLGTSGMKMDGPYDWVPPNYWYGDRLGAAYGFASELSAGPDVPGLDSLRTMLSDGELNALWSAPDTAQYHAGAPTGQFATLKLFDAALAARYGRPGSLEQYVQEAQLADYENIRAQFEAYAARMDRPGNPSTGVIYWMLNNAWPSLLWHLYGYDLVPSAGAYATKKANEPLHVLWQYDSGVVTLVNQGASGASGLTVTATVSTVDGTVRFTGTAPDLAVGSLRTATALTVPKQSGLFLVKLTLTDRTGKEVDRNVYWWSGPGDQLDWTSSDWYYTPVSRYAGLSGLMRMAPAALTATARPGADGTTVVTLTNTGSRIAFFVEASLRDGSGAPVAPVGWSDNEVSLWPGESLTLTASGAGRSVQVAGVNVPLMKVPVG
jgi:exo-1,4-beta-D-glucosaminidase